MKQQQQKYQQHQRQQQRQPNEKNNNNNNIESNEQLQLNNKNTTEQINSFLYEHFIVTSSFLQCNWFVLTDWLHETPWNGVCLFILIFYFAFALYSNRQLEVH